MSTATSSFPSTLPLTATELAFLTDPANYREFEPPFRIDVEGTVTFRDGSHGHLAPDKEALVRALIAIGERDRAYREANCHTHGTVIAECVCGRYAQAIRHCCGSPLCRDCGRSFYQYTQWLKTRDRAQLDSVAQLGIELTAPYPEGVEDGTDTHAVDRLGTQDERLPARPVSPMRRGILPYKTPRQVEAACSHIAERAKRFAKILTGSSVMHDWIDPVGRDCRIRMAIEGAGAVLRIKTLQKLWRSLVPGGTLEIHRGTGTDILQWVFQGYMPLLMLPGEDRAQYHSLFGRHAHHIRTTGKFYRCLPKTEQARRATEHLAHAGGCACPNCARPIEIKPKTEQHAEPRSAIDSRYERVDWIRLNEPAQVIRVQPITDKSEADAVDGPYDALQSRYGPS